ncbi:MAG: efflux RND transporter periplasmic adaptor subunit [Bacteroidales bacterium]|nr:efflux RND transporter periplasmic adaptor subunit [Bacteroidales bacterium]
MKKKKNWILILVIFMLGAIAAIFIFGKKGQYQTVVDTQAVTTGTVETTVTATGEIQPVYKVEVGTQVSGIVKKLYVDYNTQVKKGQLLAELDKSTLQEQVKQSKANLSTSSSNKDLAQKSFDRVKTLYEKKAATQEEYDQAESSLKQAQNQLVTARSNYENALTNLKYAEIYSPIDGVVLSKSVEEGQTVASSFSTPTIFTIANNLAEMQVEADVDEADIGMVKNGQSVTFTVDAFPNDLFTGTVKQIRLEPTVTNNVVTYTVIIEAPNPDGKLYPGMTANVSIVVESQTGLLIPLEATYFNIDPATAKSIAKDGYTVQQSAPKGKKGDGSHASVTLLNNKQLTSTSIQIGLDDGANIVVTDGLREGDLVVLKVAREKKSSSKQKDAADNPFMMGPPEKKKR